MRKTAAFSEFAASVAAGRVARRVARVLGGTGTNTMPLADVLNEQYDLYPDEIHDHKYWADKLDDMPGVKQTRSAFGLRKSGSVLTDKWGDSAHPRGHGPNSGPPRPQTLYAENTLADEKARSLAKEQAVTDIAANRRAMAAQRQGLASGLTSGLTSYSAPGLTSYSSVVKIGSDAKSDINKSENTPIEKNKIDKNFTDDAKNNFFDMSIFNHFYSKCRDPELALEATRLAVQMMAARGDKG